MIRCFNGILVYPIQDVKELRDYLAISQYYHSGGDDRARTGDLWLAKPVLSQLSYIPKSSTCASTKWWA